MGKIDMPVDIGIIFAIFLIQWRNFSNLPGSGKSLRSYAQITNFLQRFYNERCCQLQKFSINII